MVVVVAVLMMVACMVARLLVATGLVDRMLACSPGLLSSSLACFLIRLRLRVWYALFVLPLLIFFAEAVMAYISIQPELVQELVDLVRVRTDKSAQMSVPLDISVLAVHCLAALVHSR